MKNSALLIAFLLSGMTGFAAPPSRTEASRAAVGEGASLHTDAAPADLNLESGVALRLSARSTGTIFHDHLELEEGAVRVGHFEGYRIDAGGLAIEASGPGAQAVVRRGGQNVEVASIGGMVKVSDRGAMLTRVAAGTRMSFQQSAASTPAPKKLPSDRHVMVWLIGITGAAALAIGLTAAAQGKSPF
jgi:ferric-dicitrate binding protein FerR (iron transport regulator)